MHDTQMADRPHLEMRWVPVTDDEGCTRPQAVWIEAGTPAPIAQTAPTGPSTVVHHAA